jgi:hypothetical protein
MTSKAKRPVGITLLAIAFLWIGCFGALAFPIIIFSAGTIMWIQLTGLLDQSHSWLRLVAHFGEYPFFVTWFLGYVAYAFIGFGLWRLRNWARKAVLGINLFAAAVSLLVTAFFVRPAAFAGTMIAGETLPFAWIVWYLLRPRVRFAFSAEAQLGVDSSNSGIPEGMSTGGKVLTVIAVLATFGLFVGFLLFTIEGMLRRSQIYETTLNEAGQSPCVAAKVGIPFAPGWFVTGSLTESSVEGSADLEIPIHGPKGSGTLAVSAKKESGIWNIADLTLQQNGRDIELLPATSSSSCQ